MEDLFRRVCGERATLQLQLSEGAVAVTCDPGELESVLLSLAIDAVQTIVDTGELTISTHEARVIFRVEERNEIRAAYQWTGTPV